MYDRDLEREINAILRSAKSSMERSSFRNPSYPDRGAEIRRMRDAALSIESIRLTFRHALSYSEFRKEAYQELQEALQERLDDSEFRLVAQNTRFVFSAPVPKSSATSFSKLFDVRDRSVLEATILLLDSLTRGFLSDDDAPDLFSEPKQQLQRLRSVVPSQKIAPAKFDVKNGRLVLAQDELKFDAEDANCPPSAPMRQICGLEDWRISGSSYHRRGAYETEVHGFQIAA